MQEVEKLRPKESAELEEVGYSGRRYAVRIGPAYMSRKLGDRIQVRKAIVNGVELEFETNSPRGLMTNLGTIQRAAIRKYLRMGKAAKASQLVPRHRQAYEAEFDRALHQRDNWELRMLENVAVIAPLRVKWQLSRDPVRRTAQREILAAMAFSQSLHAAAKQAIACIDRRKTSEARAELTAVIEQIASYLTEAQ